jgi:hypothetical protein
MSPCKPGEHRFSFRGIVYRDTGRRLPGSAATALEHFDLYFCERCLDTFGVKTGVKRDSYHGPLDGATPAPEDMEFRSAFLKDLEGGAR